MAETAETAAMKVGPALIVTAVGQIHIKQEGTKWTESPGESRGNRYVGPFTPQEARLLAYHLLLVSENATNS